MDAQNLKIPEPLKISKIPSLDGLRAISIVFVIVCHTFNTNKVLFGFGPTGVEIFFVISGFLITTLLLKERATTNQISLKNFYIRRAFRILPLIFLFLAVLALLNYIFQLHITNRSFLTAIFFVKNLPIPNATDWYTNHFWSLAVEEQFYIIFPFLISVLSIKNYKRLLFILIPVLTILNFCFYSKIGPVYSNRTIHLFSTVLVNLFSIGTVLILVGSFLSVLIFDHPNLLNRLINVNSLLLSFIVFFIALVLRVPACHLYVPYLSSTVFAFLIGFVIIMNINRASLMAKFLNLGFMSQLGVLSYSLYVWQEIFTDNQPWGKLFAFADSKILNIGALLLVAWLSYRFYEKKFLDFKNRFKIVK